MSDTPRPESADVLERLAQLDQSVAELSLLLPVAWISALEAAAQAKGQTAAQLVRGLIRNYVTQ